MPKNYHLHLTGTVGYWNFSKDQVAYILDQYKDEEVHVLIDSLGGYAYDALSISALFKQHGNVHVHYIGANASAATISSMGAKRVTIDSDALYLVHKCLDWVDNFGLMNEDDINALIADLEKVRNEQSTLNSVVANMYAKRCRKDPAQLMELMTKDTWLTARQALDWGFVDEVTDSPDDKKAPLEKSTLTAMASAGIPLPPDASGSMPGWLRKLASVFSTEPATTVTADTENRQHTESAQSNSIDMSKSYSLLAAAVGASLAVANGKCAFDEDALDKIENTLAGNASVIADKDAKIAELEAKVKDLDKEPAATTSGVTETGAEKDDDGPSGNLSEDLKYLKSI